jgi:hypothetical protein
MVYDLVRTSLWRHFIAHDKPEFDNFGGGETPMIILVGICFRETCMVRAY